MSKQSSSGTSQTDWERIDAMKDEDIDLSDIPEITEAQMAGAVLRVGGKPTEKGKQRVNMFLDTFIVEYFKAKAGDRGYQTLINAALSEYIQNHDLKEDLRHIFREELERTRNVS
ncbi:MAG: BrnA antitoxin family protein [Phormidesmis sp. RL_2_1]|nr:BrnA antitoxin family protein [Phormidesmis sp. RL_2_1]